MKPVNKNEMRKKLSPEQYHVTFEKGTEPAFSGKYWNSKTPGTYMCVVCGEALFHSDDKYDSGSGWPSFTRPIDDNKISSEEDRSMFMHRTEIHCSSCGAHLGHVFTDGPPPAGLRYCVNSASLDLATEQKRPETEADSAGETA